MPYRHVCYCPHCPHCEPVQVRVRKRWFPWNLLTIAVGLVISGLNVYRYEFGGHEPTLPSKATPERRIVASKDEVLTTRVVISPGVRWQDGEWVANPDAHYYGTLHLTPMEHSGVVDFRLDAHPCSCPSKDSAQASR